MVIIWQYRKELKMNAILHKWIDEQSLAYAEDKMERIIVPDVGKGKEGVLNGLNAVFYLNRGTDRMVVEVMQPNRLVTDRGVGTEYCCTWNREHPIGDVLFTDDEGTHLVWRRILPSEYSAEDLDDAVEEASSALEVSQILV